MERKCHKCLMVIPKNASVCGHCRESAVVHPLSLNRTYCIHCETIIDKRLIYGTGPTCVGCGASAKDSDKAHSERVMPWYVGGGIIFIILSIVSLFTKH